MILNRYLAKEITVTFLAVIFVLLFVALSNHSASLLSQAATGQLSLELVAKIIALYIPELFSHITPLALFIAMLLAVGRMYADSEMVVFYSCGFRWSSVFKVTLVIGIVFSIITALFTMWLVPKSVVMREAAFSEGEASGAIQTVTPGRFQDMSNGNIIFYVEDKDSKNNLHKVFVAQRAKDKPGHPWTIITADKATVTKNKDNEDKFFLIMDNGKRYTGVPGEKDYTVINFEEYGREIITKKPEHIDYDRIKPTKKLIGSKKRTEITELQWRLAIPISTIVLAILGISLARVRPRQGKFAKILPAILIYIVYYNLITVSKRWLAAGKISPEVGIWWVHAVFLVLGLFLFAKESGFLYKVYYYYIKPKSKVKGK